ncbi:MAG TPA: fibronectin type III domain-containing protein [Candidatus Limnocylindrales bacterium]|nr:fibronectin type III domain-containing protein [Candidatus Limnocylindrales bacterium]
MGQTKTLWISGFLLILLVSLLCTTHAASAAPNLSATSKTETTVTLSWTKSKDATFYYYFVASSLSVNGPFNDVAIIGNSSLTRFTVTGLTKNTTYYFIVRDWGLNGVSNSTLTSNICVVTTLSTATQQSQVPKYPPLFDLLSFVIAVFVVIVVVVLLVKRRSRLADYNGLNDAGRFLQRLSSS